MVVALMLLSGHSQQVPIHNYVTRAMVRSYVSGHFMYVCNFVTFFAKLKIPYTYIV